MLKQLLSLIIISALTHPLFSQTAEVKVSQEFALKKTKVFQSHLHSDASGHYMYFFKQQFLSAEKTLSITKFDNKFEEVWSQDYLTDKKKILTYGLKSINKQMVWLLSDEPKRYTKDFFLVPIDADGELGEKVKINSIKYESSGNSPYVDWSIAEDSTMMAITQVFDYDKNKVDFEYNITVIDSDLNELWSEHIKLRKSQEQVDIISSVIGNDGANYVLVKEYDERNPAKGLGSLLTSGKKADYDLKIYKTAEGMTSPEVIELNLNDKFARGASLKVAQNGEITCIGMFSNFKRGLINGIYYLKMNANGDPISTNIKAFSKNDLEFLGSRNTEKDRAGNEGIEGFFDFGEQLLLDDGSIVVTAEENYVTTRRDNQGNVSYVYHSNDIVVITFEPDGAINSIKLIPKRQKSGAKAFLSHSAMSINNKGAFFFYNDDKDNIDRPLDKRAKRISSMSDCVTTCAFLDLEGNIKREAMINNKEIKALLLPYACNRLNENTFFFVAMKPKLLAKSNFRIGTIEIQ